MSFNINELTNQLSHSSLKELLLRGMADVEFCLSQNTEISQAEGLFVSTLAEYWGLPINSTSDTPKLREKLESTLKALNRKDLRNLIDAAFFEEESRLFVYKHYTGLVSVRNGIIENEFSTLDGIKPGKNGQSKIYMRIKGDETTSNKELIKLSKIFGDSWMFTLNFHADTNEDESSFSINYRFNASKLENGGWTSCSFAVNAEMPFSLRSLKETYESNISSHDFTDDHFQEYKHIIDVIDRHSLKEKLVVDLKQNKDVKKRVKI